MPKYRIHAKVIGSKYLGEFEAKNKDEAINLAYKKTHVSFCHECTDNCEDPEIEITDVEEVK